MGCLVQQRIKREKLRFSNHHTHLYEDDNAFPMGSWVVWWYGRLQKNAAAQTVPLVLVTLQQIDGDVLTGHFKVCKIAVSRLAFYPCGLILEDRRPVAKISYETLWFDVEYGYGGWNFFQASSLGLCASTSQYPLPSDCAGDWSLAFNQRKGRVLVNCVDFLVRGYAHRSEIPRILTTYRWGPAKSRLFAKSTPDHEKGLPDRLIVYPHPRMVDADETLLAYLANDPHSIRAASSIFSDADTQSYRNGIPHTPQVKPWFKGKTRIECRGFWTNKGEDFLCVEMRDFKPPEGKLVESFRPRPAQREGAPDDRIRRPELQRKLTENDIDVSATDVHEPRSEFPVYDIPVETRSSANDPNKIRRYIDDPYHRSRVVPLDKAPPDKHSTGDNAGQSDPDTGKITVTACVGEAEFGGALLEMWKSFTRLKAAGQLQNVYWYKPHNVFVTGPPEYIEFSEQIFTGQQDPEGKLTKWLNHRQDRRRAMMAFYLQAKDKNYLVIEPERTRYQSKDGTQKETTSSGLICEVSGPRELKLVHSFIDHELPKHAGVFGNLFKKTAWPLEGKFAVYRHRLHSDEEAWLDQAAANALKRMGVKIKLPKKPEQVDPLTRPRAEPTIVQPA